MLRFENVTKDYQTEDGRTVRALDRFSLEVQRGELVVMMGPNGSGKTTSLRILDGQETPTEGQVVWDVGPTKTSRNGRPRIAHVPQDARALSFPEMTLEEHLLMAELASGFARCWARGITRARRQRYRTLLKDYRVEPLIEALPRSLRTLSGGWQQVFAILCAALGPTLREDGASPPDVTVLDEPTAALDLENTRICLDLIQRLNQDGQTVILATHNIDLLNLAGRLVVLHAGRVTEELPRSEVALRGIAGIREILRSRIGNDGQARSL